jgi:ABC-type multidrug transport system fused ATPase/permease subunit
LLLEEIKNGDETSGDERHPSSECKVECQKVTAKWPAQIAESSLLEDPDYTLRDISFKVGPSQVLAVVGKVGSGKVYIVITI